MDNDLQFIFVSIVMKTIDFFFNSLNWTNLTTNVWNVNLPIKINNCFNVKIESYTYHPTGITSNTAIILTEESTINFTYLSDSMETINALVTISKGRYDITRLLNLISIEITSLLSNASLNLYLIDSKVNFTINTPYFGTLSTGITSNLMNILGLTNNTVYHTYANTTFNNIYEDSFAINKLYFKFYSNATVTLSLDGTSKTYTNTDILYYNEWFEALQIFIRSNSIFTDLTIAWNGSSFSISSSISGTFIWSPTAASDDYTSNSILYYLGFAQNTSITFPGTLTGGTMAIPNDNQITLRSDYTGTFSYYFYEYNYSDSSIYGPDDTPVYKNYLAGTTLGTIVSDIYSLFYSLGENHILFQIANRYITKYGPKHSYIFFIPGNYNTIYLRVNNGYFFQLLFANLNWNIPQVVYRNYSLSGSSITYNAVLKIDPLYLCSDLCNNIFKNNDHSKIILNILNDATMTFPLIKQNVNFVPHRPSFQEFTIYLLNKNLENVTEKTQQLVIHFKFYYNE